MSDPIVLMRALGLEVVSKGPNGRYPRGAPGPLTGYNYWANFAHGRFRFGVQSDPKAEIDPQLLARFQAAGFEIMPARTEAYAWVGRTLEEAVDQARVTMAIVQKVLAGEKI